MLWRQDTDQVYALYDDRSGDTVVVDSPSLAGFLKCRSWSKGPLVMCMTPIRTFPVK
jgi:hypothetical protein